MDFTDDIKHLQCNNTNGELRYFELMGGKERTTLSGISDFKYEKMSCIYGWQV